ncbi:hypothetical protein BV22DRAFT_1032401 [Leucogyrophana mollusca]|uniref:Uncharacterized protein n=1 Tax=Leucogyrophana mollusca TaxID=85980 RepID=A0ACB8BPX2_9AGAM|nr:hypothetical protein BV22DRAFT_1032401 [Leucogyrophana mollusca]
MNRAFNQSARPMSSHSEVDLRERICQREEVLHVIRENLAKLTLEEKRMGAALSMLRSKFPERKSDLPVELWRQIFMLCRPAPLLRGVAQTDCTSNADFCEPNCDAAPILLTRICRRWRDIALSTPELWASLRIYVDRYKEETQVVAFVFMLEWWLENSGTYLLNLQLEDDEPSDDRYSLDSGDSQHRERISVWPSVVHLLRAHASRWKSLILSASLLQWHLIFNPGLSTHMLETLSCPDWSITSDGRDILSGASRLRSLRLHRLHPSALVRGSVCAHLQHLHLSGSHAADEIVEILSLLPGLSSLVIVAPTRNRAGTYTKSLPHPTLESLQVHSSLGLLTLLVQLQLPSLRYLHVRGLIPAWMLPYIIALLTRSSCSLCELRIEAMSCKLTKHKFADRDANEILQIQPGCRIYIGEDEFHGSVEMLTSVPRDYDSPYHSLVIRS